MLPTTMIALLLGLTSSTAAKPAAVKWSQSMDGSLTAVFQLKRGKSELCEGERAKVVDDGMQLVYQMTCSGDAYELSVLMPHAVIPDRVYVRRVHAEAHVTMHKSDPGLWWSSLAKHPDHYKTLVQRDTQRGDLEPDEDELANSKAMVLAQRAGGSSSERGQQQQQKRVAASVDAASGGAAPLGGRAKEEERMRKAKLDADISAAMEIAMSELDADGVVTPHTVSMFKELHRVAPKNGRVAMILSYLLLKRGEEAKLVIPLLRKAIELDPNQPGSHQQLAQLLTSNERASTPDEQLAMAREAAQLYFKGSLLLPTDAETYFQLGRYLTMIEGGKKWPAATSSTKGKKGKKSKQAAADAVDDVDRPPGSAQARGDVYAWRTAIKLKPDMAEAMQMLSLRFARNGRGKKDRESARKLASKALSLEPASAVSYLTVGFAAAPDPYQLAESHREKATAAFRTAIQLDDKQIGSGSGLTPARRAEMMHHLGLIYASKKNPSTAEGQEALDLFRAAVDLMPSEAKYREALEALREGITSYTNGIRARQQQREEAEFKRLQAEEDAAYEVDAKFERFSSIR